MKSIIRGFTLLEVLVALAILAISATAVIRQTGGSLAQLSALQSKTTAMVLAENQLDLTVEGDAFPPLGRGSRYVTFDGIRWRVETEVSSTSDPWLRKVAVSVSTENREDYPLASLIGYRGKY